MSHYTLLVAGTNLSDRMDKFSELTEVPPYIDTREEWETELAEARKAYAELVTRTTAANARAHYAKLADPATDPVQVLTNWSGRGTWKPRENGEGYDKWTTSNPDGFWDWFVIGGRWDKGLVTKSGERTNETTAGELDFDHEECTPFHAYLTTDDEWVQRGRMGWFATVADGKPEKDWDAECREWIASLPADTPLTLIDCHV